MLVNQSFPQGPEENYGLKIFKNIKRSNLYKLVASHTIVSHCTEAISETYMILGAKFFKWAKFPWVFPKNDLLMITFSKNNSPKFHRIKLFYLKNRQNSIETI